MRNLFATSTLISFLMFASGAGAQIVSSSIDNVPIGATIPSTGKFTNLEATGTLETTTLEATTNITLGGTTITEFSEISSELFNSNVLLNSYRTAENNDLSILKMIDGAVDAFTDETGVDTTASTNEDFQGSSKLYRPTTTGATTIPMIKFSGSNNLTRVATGDSDSKVGTISLLFRPNHNLTAQSYILTHQGNFFHIGTNPSAKLVIGAFSSSTSQYILDTKSTTTLTTGTLYHIVASWDMATGDFHLYINGVDDSPTVTTITNESIDYSRSTSEVASDSSPGNLSAMDIGQLYFNRSVYIDLSVASNLKEFIDSRGNPIDLESDGSGPTGTAPEIFLNNTLSTWQTNLGLDGNFTVEGPALASGSPSTVSTTGTPDNLTLISNSQTAKTQPSDASILLLAEDAGADIVLNTQLKAWVSRDGGTNFSQVTLADAGEFEDGNLLTGIVALTGTGTDMQWKVETSGIDINLHGVGLEWR